MWTQINTLAPALGLFGERLLKIIREKKAYVEGVSNSLSVMVTFSPVSCYPWLHVSGLKENVGLGSAFKVN